MKSGDGVGSRMGISSAACWKKAAAPDIGSTFDMEVMGVVCAAMASCSAFSCSMSDNSVDTGGGLSTGGACEAGVSDAVFSAACSSAFAFALFTFAFAEAINLSNPA